MKGFIEVTRIFNDSAEERKCLVSISAIKSIESDTGGMFIVFKALEKKWNQPWYALGYLVKETYDEVVAKIKKAIE